MEEDAHMTSPGGNTANAPVVDTAATTNNNNTTNTPSRSQTTTNLLQQQLEVQRSHIGILEQMQQQQQAFTEYMMRQKASSIDMPKYNPKDSLRLYIRSFLSIAMESGITNRNMLVPILIKHMPDSIRMWMVNLSSTTRQHWELTTMELLAYFSISEEEENRKAIVDLRSTVQKTKQSIREHTSNWYMKYRIVAQSTAVLPDSEAKTMFIQSFKDMGIRSTLTATTVNFPLGLPSLVELALKIGENVTPGELSTQVPQEEVKQDDPMELDYVHGKFNKKNNNGKFNKHNKGKYNKKANKGKRQDDGVPRLYDKNGNPVCGHCGGSHKNFQCSKTKQVAGINADESDLMELGVIHANSVNYMKEAKATYFTPTTEVVIAHRSVSALWDSGSAITVISNQVCQDLNLTVDKSVVIQYQDVNKVVKDTLGSVTLNLFGDSIKLQVVEGLAREIILGYNLMKRWNAVLHANNNYVLLEVNNKKFKVNISSRKPDSNNNVFATDAQQAQIKEVLKQYTDVLAHKDDKPGVTDLIEFTIDTGDNPPVYTTPRPYHPRIQKQIDDKFEELIRNGICSKVDFTDWGSPVTVVPKPDGSIRLCGNYVKLNAITKPIKYPFVNLHMALQSLGQAKVFSKVDLLSSYHQIPIKEEHKVKSALVTTTSTYIFHTMGMGMRNCPAVFQSLMDRVLGDMRYQTAIGYQDDVIVFSPTFEQHVQDLNKLMSRLQQAKLTVNIDKCAFAVDSEKFLGFIVSGDGVHADPAKVEPIVKLPAPTNIKELERFLGLTGVYSKFMSQYQLLAEPLRRLKIKDTPFTWGEEQQQAFLKLKAKLQELPILRQPDFSKQFELHCDAANTAGIAVVLCQRVDGTPYPLAFASRALTKHEKNYSIRELEALAIVFGVKKFRVYLECNQFLVFTDHSSLMWLLSTNQDKQPRLWRWCLFLQSYDFLVKYIPGKNNHAPDALSRSTVFAISISTNLDKLLCKEEQLKDADLSKYFTKESTDKSYILVQGILHKLVPKPRNLLQNNKFKVVPKHLVTKVLEEFHNTRLTGHGGVGKTLYNLKRSQLWWNRMHLDVLKYVKASTVCQQVKGNRSYQHHVGTTHGEYPFHRISIDYFGPLPVSSSGNSYIMVVMDTFSKYVEIYPMRSILSMDLAKVFYYKFVTRHGLPVEILSDNGVTLGTEFTKELAKYLEIDLKFTPPRHPESNGIVERFMRSLRLMILTYVEQPLIMTEWDSKLRLVRFIYNNMLNQATGFAPFEIIHGRSARTTQAAFKDENKPKLYRDTVDTPQSQFAAALKEDLEAIVELVYDKLSGAHQGQDDTSASAIKEGDLVYMFNTAGSSKKRPRKLSMDWLGPMKIVKVISGTRYDVMEHEARSKKVHHNVHISLLKKHHN